MDADVTKAGRIPPGLGLKSEWRAFGREGRGMTGEEIVLSAGFLESQLALSREINASIGRVHLQFRLHYSAMPFTL